MGIRRYFKKEIYKHYFLCSIPFIAMILILICQMMYFNGVEYSDEFGQKELVLTSFLIFYAIFFLIGMILFSTYLYSYKKYKKMISLFTKEELERINNEAITVYNMGKLLITNDVVIFFGFYKKEVIPTKIIEDVEKVEATYEAEGRGLKMSIDYQNIILKCENNKQVVIPAPKNYSNTECENCKKIIKYIIGNRNLNKEEYVNINSLEEAGIFRDYKQIRFSNFMGFIGIVPYIVICLIINRAIKNEVANGSDFVLKIFYNIGIEEFLVFIESVIYTIIFVIINIYYRVHNKNIVKGNTVTKYYKSIMFLVLIFLNWLFMATSNYDYQKDVRSDYVSYLKNECKTYTGKVSYYEGVNYKDVSWTSYYHGEVIYLYANHQILVSTEESIDENKIYKITYLPKTRFIVDINKETKD